MRNLHESLSLFSFCEKKLSGMKVGIENEAMNL